MDEETAIRSLIGEQIVAVFIDDKKEAVNLCTANGLVIICLAAGIYKTEEVVTH